MPGDVPVATMAVGMGGPRNAGIFAVQILADVKARVMIETTFFSFGSFGTSKEQTKTVSIWPIDLKDDLVIERIEVVNPPARFPKDHIVVDIQKPDPVGAIIKINVAILVMIQGATAPFDFGAIAIKTDLKFGDVTQCMTSGWHFK